MKRPRDEIRAYRYDLDTQGSPALALHSDGLPLALVLAQPKREADLPHLLEAYSRLYSHLLTRLPSGEWDGSPLRVVLTQRVGALWDLCVGMAGTVERVMALGRYNLEQVGRGEIWNYWDNIRLDDPTYPDRWLAAAQSRGYLLQVIRPGEQAGTAFIQELTVRIPAAAVMVRRR